MAKNDKTNKADFKKSPDRKPRENKKISAKTTIKYLRISPRKLRLTAAAVKVLPPQKALNQLKFLNKKSALIMAKGIKTAMADAKNNFGADIKTLTFKKITVGEGPRLKRMDKSHGARFNSGLIRKRMSHLFIEVEGGLAKNGTKS